MKRIATLLACLFGMAAPALAQDGDLVFNDTLLHSLRIVTPLVHWFDTLENDYQLNAQDPDSFPEIYRECDVYWDGVQVANCGFREKGNFSNQIIQGRKQPFKVAFDAFLDNQRFDGLKKINLHNFTNDPSLVHDVAAYSLMRAVGVPGCRTAYTQLWVNDEYIGLYLVVENIDKTYLKRHYGSQGNDGNLYKTGRESRVFLNWLGTDTLPYQAQGLTLSTNEDSQDWSGFIEFVDLINNDHSPDFQAKFEAKFDVHGYLKVLAVEKCIRSWDNYFGGGNNFFLYDHPDGRFRFIPWDMNETFQDVRLLRGTTLTDGYLVPSKNMDDRPLLQRIFAIDEYRQEYLQFVCDLIHGPFTLEQLGPVLARYHEIADTAYFSDPNKFNSYEAFAHSLTATHLDEINLFNTAYEVRLRYPGIFPLIEAQRAWAHEQLAGWSMDCAPLSEQEVAALSIYPNPAQGEAYIASTDTVFDYAQIQVVDLSGREVRNSGFVFHDRMPYRLDLTGVSPGMYVVVKRNVNGIVGRGKLLVR